MRKERAVQLNRGLLVALVLVVLIGAAVRAQEEIPELQTTPWEIGMYWTYETVTRYSGGSINKGPVTFVVLGKGDWLGVDRFVVGVIWEWYDRSKRVAAFEPLAWPSFILSWPPIVEFLSAAETTSSETGLTFALTQTSLALGSKPVHIERVIGSTGDDSPPAQQLPDWLSPELGTTPIVETVTLAVGEPAELAVSAGIFANATPVDYTWTGFHSRVAGRAWWSPDLAWWAHAEGREETEEGFLALSYTVTLTERGVLTAEKLADSLASAVQSMQSAGHFPTEWIRALLVRLGFDLT